MERGGFDDTHLIVPLSFQVPDHLSVSDLALAQGGGPLPLVLTQDVQRGLNMFHPWLSGSNKQPFLIVGPEGCGKELLLRYSFEQLRSVQVAVIYCSAQTNATHVIQKLTQVYSVAPPIFMRVHVFALFQVCMVISTNTGRVYRPRDSERLIVYLKDLNLPKPDKWGTSQLIAFLQQVRNCTCACACLFRMRQRIALFQPSPDNHSRNNEAYPFN